MAVVIKVKGTSRYTPLRSQDSQLLRGQARWPFRALPQPTGIYRTSTSWINEATATANDIWQYQIAGLDQVPTEVFVPVSVRLTSKIQHASAPLEGVSYAQDAIGNSQWSVWPMSARDNGGLNWSDWGSSPSGNLPTRVDEFIVDDLSSLRSRMIQGDVFGGNFRPYFSFKIAKSVVVGEEWHLQMDVVYLGFPSSMHDTGSLPWTLLNN